MTNLLEAIEKGQFGNLGKPDRIIETVISMIFFFGDDVYKVYKYEKYYFGDFSDDRFRHEFCHDDFIWNNTMAPEIYTKLGYVKNNNGVFEETTHDQSEDYFIKMKKVDDSKSLFNLLKSKSVTEQDLEKITEEMFFRVRKLTEIKKGDFKDLFEIPYKELDLDVAETDREWLYLPKNLISKKEADNFVESLKKFILKYPYFETFNKNDYLLSIDDHSGNIIYQDERVDFIDSMPPMRIWRIQSDIYIVSRLAVDAEVILGKKFADAIYNRFAHIKGEPIDAKMKIYLQAVAASIQAAYLTILKDHILAKKFWNFAQEKANFLSKV